jgi:sarcosine oxidase subunit alpha
VVGEERAIFARCENVILATGCHAATLAFENNDLPGIWSAEAALRLLRLGIAVGQRVVIVGRGRFGDALAQMPSAVRRVSEASLMRAVGRSRVSGVLLRANRREEKIACDALVIDGPGAPTSELVGQAGGRLKFRAERGFVPELDADNRCAPRVYCAGSLTGDDRDGIEDGKRVGALLAKLHP